MSRIKVTCKEVQLHLMSQSTLTLFYFLFSLKYLRQKLLHSQTRVRLFYCFLEGKTKTKKTPELSETKTSRKYKLFLNSISSRGSVRSLSFGFGQSYYSVFSINRPAKQRPIRLSVIITSLIDPQSITRHECDPNSKADQDLKLLTTENIGPLITAFKGRSVNNGVMEERNEAA